MAAAEAGATLRWHWEDPFNPAERAKLRHWVTATQEALERLTAPLPFTVHLYVHRLQGRGEPVPWANTRRGDRQGIDLYVDPSWPLEAFLQDWTAAHELSHLLLPYLGSRHSWFAEGFASYLQYLVLAELGVIRHRDAVSAYRERIEHAASAYADYEFDGLSFIEAAARLRQQRAYPVYYWGGAVYFMTIEAQLQAAAAPGLCALLARYLACCRQREEGFDVLLASLDRLSGTSLFTDQLAELRRRRGFPAHDNVLEWVETAGVVHSPGASRNKAASSASKGTGSQQEQ